MQGDQNQQRYGVANHPPAAGLTPETISECSPESYKNESQECLEEDRWGYTCNNITWECPDCGGFRSF